MQFTTSLIEDARKYWQNTLDLNPDAGIVTTLSEFFQNERPEQPTKAEIEVLAFEILTTLPAEH